MVISNKLNKPEVSKSSLITPWKPEIIEVDGTCDRQRELIRIDGSPVRLTSKSFKYFAKLAWYRVNNGQGWIWKEDIEMGYNQARYLYRMKGELEEALGKGWEVVENNRLGYYRLNADPERIEINMGNMMNHHDWEIRDLVNLVNLDTKIE